MIFYVMALVMTAAAGLLGLRFLLAGGGVLKEWGVEPTTGALILFRRIGAMYLGLALMLFLARSAEPSELRSAACLVLGGVIALLAGLGVFELQSRRVGPGIFRSVIAEAAIAAAFVGVWWAGR